MTDGKFGSSDIQKADFGQLLDTGRILWPTYFQLAAMTFAWNASLAAGATFVFFRLAGITAADKEYGLMQIAIYTLSVIGIVYNAGALSAYVLMNKIQRQIIHAIADFPEDLSQSVTATVLRSYVRPDRAQILKHLTHAFFVVLCLAWAAFLLAAIDL